MVNPDIFTVIFGGCHLAAILFSPRSERIHSNRGG
nr:MAG TPA: hypothetical protein [Caudoviricetes sp.]